MLLIYTHKITNRFSYTMKHLFNHIMGIEVDFTAKVEDFIKHKGAKITYSKQPLQNEFFIRSNDLLFEQGINAIQIKVRDWNGVPCFFETDQRSTIPFDIFSASFYMLSRYEEYLPHVKDELGRFPPQASLAYRNDFLDIPVVDLWAQFFLKVLKEKFPAISIRSSAYQFTSIIKVTTSHCFALRGFGRSVGGLLHDAYRLKLSRLVKRIVVWFNPIKDPYDNFSELKEIHKKFDLKALFFFQLADYSTHDRNISIYRSQFRHLIKTVADYNPVYLSASMAAGEALDTLKLEKKRLSNLIHRSVNSIRMRYNKVVLPHTYRELVEAEFTNDYSMGYTHHIGFRAGTSFPFPFYDINLEVQQPIKVYPFVFCDYALTHFSSLNEVHTKLDNVWDTIKSVKGHWVMVFSNELLGEKHRLNWMKLYQSLIKRYRV